MTRATCNELADYQWLTSDAARSLLDALAADSAPLHTTVARLRTSLSPARAHLAIEQVDLRRRAATKFAHSDRMFFTRTALEQATDQWIAAYKAARVGEFLRSKIRRGENSHSSLGETRPLADLCCGIGGDFLALAEHSTVIGIDSNPVATHLAAANARVVLNQDIEIRTLDVAESDLGTVTAWHIDPDRRPTGRRTTSLEFCTPDRAAIDRLLARVPHAAIKLAPATVVPVDWAERCEREWISRDRECRQQVAWHGNLAQAPGRHRATILDSPPRYSGSKTRRGEEGLGEGSPRTITGTPNQSAPITHQPARYIFDVDSAVRAAHLTGTLAAEHDLQALSTGPTYLTGDTAIANDPAIDCFEVLELFPLRTRTLSQLLRAQHIGQLEIKKRGIDLDPDAFRRNLRLRGDNAATLLITNIAQGPTAILARRVCGTP